MKRIYVAGAYSDDNVLGVLRNIGRGEWFASYLFEIGYAPFTPWHDKSFVINNWHKEFTVSEFYEYGMKWLEVSDAICVIPNVEGLKDWQDSKGTLAEIKKAEELGIPVFYTVQTMNEHFGISETEIFKKQMKKSMRFNW